MRQAAILSLALAFFAQPLQARSRFDGVWRLAPESTDASGIRYDIALKDGVFTCRWCKPVWSIPADGAFHAVVGQPRYDEASVRIIDKWSAAFARKRRGRIFYQAIDVISRDEKLMAFSFSEVSDDGKVESGNGLWKRLSPKPAGAHAVTGEWRELWVTSKSDDDVTFTIRTQGDQVRVEFAPDEILTAKFGGPPAKIEGDSRGTMASLRKLGRNAFIETDYRDGHVVSVTTSRLINPTTMQIIVENKRNGSKSHYTAHQQ